MFKKLFAFATFAFLALPLFAEKPFAVAICSDQSIPMYQNQQDARAASLVQEYYKSEIATQSRLVLCDSDLLQESIAELKHKSGTAYTEAELKKLATQTKADFISFVAIIRKDKDAVIRISLYDKNGKKVDKELTQPISTIRESDLPAIQLALETSKAIRGSDDVDVLARERMIDLQSKIEQDRVAEDKKAKKKALELQKN